MGQVERPHARAVQAGIRGQRDDRAMLEMLLCEWRKKEVQHQRHVEETKPNHLASFQSRAQRQH